MYKRTGLFLLCMTACSTLSAQTATFPAAVVTNSQMMVAGNNLNTTLTAPVGATDTTMTLASSVGFLPDMLISFSDSKEISVVCAVNGNVVTIGYNGVCPSTTGRGFDGSTATTHRQAAQVAGFYVAWHHNVARVEIEAIEQALGPNLANVNALITATSYGAKGDAKSVSNAAMTSSSNVLTSASAGFAVGDLGKTVLVAGAGAAGANFRATITGFNSSTSVSLSATASTSVSSAQMTFGTINTTSLNTLFASQPSGIIMFPPGIYLISNAAGGNGMTVNAFHGSILMAPGASVMCTTNDQTAGPCVHFIGSGGAVSGLDIKYFNQNVLPIARSLASGYAVLADGANNNLAFYNTIVEASTGSGVWVSGASTEMSFFNTFILNTSADGLHCDNSSCKIDGLTTINTLDDGLAFTNSTGSGTICGDFAVNVSIRNSAARGIANAGACDVYVSQFLVNNTQSDGILNLTDGAFSTLRPVHAKYANGRILNAGLYTNALNPTGGNKFGIEILLSDDVSLSDIEITTPVSRGVQIGSADANSVSNLQMSNVFVQSAGDDAFNFSQSNHVDVSNLRADSPAGYGIAMTAMSDMTQSNITVRNCTQSLHRAWFSVSSLGAIAASNLNIVDDQVSPTCFVVGEASSAGNLSVIGLNTAITNGSLTINRFSTTARFATPNPLNAPILGTDNTGSPILVSTAPGGTTNVSTYGAKGNAISLTNAAMTATSPTVSASGANFAAGDVGKVALIAGAGTAGANLRGTIAAVTDSSHFTLSTPAITTVSGRALTYGNVDTTAIQSAFAANPRGIIQFQAGIYLLDNASGADGLQVNGFVGSILASVGATFLCTTSDTSAGACFHLIATTGDVDGVDIRYFNQTAGLPLARASATNYAYLIDNSNNLKVNQVTVEASTGAGLWINNSTNVFVYGALVTNTTSNGVECVNSGCKFFGVHTEVTLGAGIVAANTNAGSNCGVYASNVSVHNAGVYGIADQGACDVYVDGFTINNTQSSGVAIIIDPNTSRRSVVSKFSHGKIISAGRYTNALAPLTGNQFGIEISASDQVGLDDIDVNNPLLDGMVVGTGTANSVTYFKAENVTVLTSPGACFTMSNVTHSDLSNIRLDSCQGYGFFQNALNDSQQTNVTIRNASLGGTTFNRTWWSQSSLGLIAVSNLNIVDDQVTPTGFVVGEVSSGANLSVIGLNTQIPNGSLTIARNTSTARFAIPLPLSAAVLASDANGSGVAGTPGACATCVVATSPGVGIAHFAGSTQTVTSSLIVAADVTSATITGTQIASNVALAGSPTTTTQSADDASTKVATTAYVDRMKTRSINFSVGDPGGSALTAAATTTAYFTVPYTCSISAWNLLIDAGTITVKFWKIASGTAIPTSANSINTSGVAISSGTAIHSTTLSDFTSTAVTANDIMAMNVTVVATAKYVSGTLQCDQ